MDSIGQQVEMEIASIIANRMRMTTLTSVFGYGLQAFVLKDYVPHTLLTLWVCALVCCEIINHVLAVRARTQLHNARTRNRYLRRQMCGVLLSGSCWGLSSWLPDLWQQPLAFVSNFSILVLVGIFAIHNMCLRWELLAAFSAGLIGSTFVLAVGQADGFSAIAIAASAIGFGMVQVYGFSSRQLQKKQILNHFEMQKLAEEVTQKNKELTRLVEEVEHLASHDPLTHCLNRRALSERYSSAGARGPASSNSSRPLGVIMVDADHFKKVNDQHGHDAGDQVLVAIVGRMTSQLRASDSLARWGGEEFLCVLPGVQMDGLQARAERIRRAIADHPVSCQTHSLNITASLGIALMREQESFEDTVKRADQALYQAKHAGRNRVVGEISL
ncbi:MAG: GGDEF domain-containing protein [Burkholderiales bacterium]|nr:GGDEF domain-containing protein [Burkholderiales bacterium]